MLCVCVCPGEGNVAFNATPNPFHLNKICLNQKCKYDKETFVHIENTKGTFPVSFAYLFIITIVGHL